MLASLLRSRRLARGGLFATALLLGAGLTATAWTSWREAEKLADTLSEGQAERVLEDLRGRLGPPHHPDTRAQLEALLAARAKEGLRGVATYDSELELEEVVGVLSTQSLTPEERKAARTLRRLETHVRFVTFRPPPPAGTPPSTNRGLPPRMVVEFEPVLASGLLERARRTFVLGSGVAAILVAAAVFFLERARRADALAEHLAHKERLASLGTMSAVLAHEIKNPLTALKGHGQLLVEALPEGSRPRAQAERVVDGAVRIQGLITNLLDFARGEMLERAPCDPLDLLRAAASDAAPSASIEAAGAPSSWPLDRARMRQVLENLLRNAAQAADGGAVSARVSVEEQRLVYAVSDQGPGLPPGGEERIFEPFFTTKTRGVGLGLAVARRIVEMHGGDIRAKNLAQGGAEFRVSIPRA